MRKIPVEHPGIILQEEFLDEMDISQYALAKATDIPKTRIHAIVSGDRSITPDTALRLSLFFGNSAEFWLNLQKQYDLAQVTDSFTPPKNFMTAKELLSSWGHSWGQVLQYHNWKLKGA